jgi:hypothetical protein
MKKLKFLLFFLPFALFLIGCPVGLDFPLDELGKNPLDQKLIGTWESENEDGTIKKMKISEEGNNTYKIEIITRGEMYSLEEDIHKGWVTELGGYTFFYSKPLNEEKYYHHIYKLIDSKTLVTNDFSLLDGGVDAVTSTEALRAQVLTSSKMEGFLGEEITYKKVD